MNDDVPPSETKFSRATSVPPSDQPVMPGWYTTDRERIVQGYWDGTKWSKSRRWRGVGFFEEDLPPEVLAANATAGAPTGLEGMNPATESAASGMATITALRPNMGGHPVHEPASMAPPRPPSDPPSGQPPSAEAAQPGPGLQPPLTSFTPPVTGSFPRPASVPRTTSASLPSRPVSMPSPMPPQSPPATNGLAIASLVLSILCLFGIGSVLGIIFGAKARKEIRWSRGNQGGDGLALAGIIVGICTLTIVVVVATMWVIGFVTLTNHVENGVATSSEVLACQADVKSVDIAVSAYQAENGTYPTPPALWSAANYQTNYRPLTSGSEGGPWLRSAPSTGMYVIEYNAAGNVWVTSPGVYESTPQTDQVLGSNPEACDNAVG